MSSKQPRRDTPTQNPSTSERTRSQSPPRTHTSRRPPAPVLGRYLEQRGNYSKGYVSITERARPQSKAQPRSRPHVQVQAEPKHPTSDHHQYRRSDVPTQSNSRFFETLQQPYEPPGYLPRSGRIRRSSLPLSNLGLSPASNPARRDLLNLEKGFGEYRSPDPNQDPSEPQNQSQNRRRGQGRVSGQHQNQGQCQVIGWDPSQDPRQDSQADQGQSQVPPQSQGEGQDQGQGPIQAQAQDQAQSQVQDQDQVQSQVQVQRQLEHARNMRFMIELTPHPPYPPSQYYRYQQVQPIPSTSTSQAGPVQLTAQQRLQELLHRQREVLSNPVPLSYERSQTPLPPLSASVVPPNSAIQVYSTMDVPHQPAPFGVNDYLENLMMFPSRSFVSQPRGGASISVIPDSDPDPDLDPGVTPRRVASHSPMVDPTPSLPGHQ